MRKSMRREILVWAAVTLVSEVVIWNPSVHFGLLTSWKAIVIKIEMSILLPISIFFFTVLAFAVTGAMKEIDDELRRKDARRR